MQATHVHTTWRYVMIRYFGLHALKETHDLTKLVHRQVTNHHSNEVAKHRFWATMRFRENQVCVIPLVFRSKKGARKFSFDFFERNEERFFINKQGGGVQERIKKKSLTFSKIPSLLTIEAAVIKKYGTQRHGALRPRCCPNKVTPFET